MFYHYMNEKEIKCVSLGNSGEEIAHNIFDCLRKYEKQNGFLIIQAFDGKGIEVGIMNRLIKSSHGKII